MKPEYFPTVEAFSRASAQAVVRLARQAIDERGRFSLALSGGSTPIPVYEALSHPGYMEEMEWDKVHVFFGDERMVPPDNGLSNYRMAREAMLGHVPLPEENIHRIMGEADTAGWAANLYEGELRAFFETPMPEVPSFDLILLGMGEDGHVASLFPGREALEETRRLAVETQAPERGAWVTRVTLTLPVINNARNILFLIAGRKKLALARRIFDIPDRGARAIPAAMVDARENLLVHILQEEE